MDDRTRTLAGWCGLTWAALTTAAAFSGGAAPALDAPADEITTYLHDHRGVFLATVVVFALTLPMLLVFAGALIGRLRDGTDKGNTAALLAGAGLGVSLACSAVANALLVPVLQQDLGVDPETVKFLYAGVFAVTIAGNAAAAAMMFGFAAAGANAGLGTVVTRSAAAIGVIVLVLSAAGLADESMGALAPVGLLPFVVWIVAVSIGMIRRPSAVPAVAAAVATVGA